MKKLMLLVLSAFFGHPVFATSDAHDRVYLVVQHLSESEDFFVERVPIIGCYGPLRGPHLAQFTSEYKVNSNIGCGGKALSENINYLTCAKITSHKESPDYQSFSEITLDISNCEAKNNTQFITMVRTAAKLNFPLKNGEVKLTLVKK
ncbi:MAG: hypothetical protein IPK68_15010 [Bdellovibrionales bacterium]|nr:hypothetical protein [Bdellovibrionales bacterium]